MIKSPGQSPKPDRLAAFFDAFRLQVRVLPPGAPAGPSTLHVTADASGEAEAVVLTVRGSEAPARSLVSAEVAFGSTRNPLLNSLPDSVRVPLQGESPGLPDTVRAFLAELTAARCGRSHAMDRLGEVIVLMLLRAAIERGAAGPCLLAGLAHPQLHRVLVAMHESPAHAWDTEELARIAGMSRSRFMATFPQVVGTTPMDYLTTWRLQFGQRELLKGGARVKEVARRAGFSSAEAFSRAYARAFGRAPVQEAARRGDAGCRENH
jgi:AraC-like DNA-binding protein